MRSVICVDKTIHMFGSTENRRLVRSEICVDKTIHMFGSTENRRLVRSVLTRPYTCLVLQRTEGK